MILLRKAPPAIELPAALLSQGFALRPETEADMPFLQQLYASTRAEEMTAVIDWTEEQKRQFLLSQFAAQRHHYRTYYADAAFDVLTQRGVPAGRLYLDESDKRMHIIDIALMPQWRGKGIGAALLQAVIERARAQRKIVDIFVERFNPALNLYLRLGFVVIREAEVHLLLERPPEA